MRDSSAVIKCPRPWWLVTCALFIRTYWKDLDWLSLCLASVERHCRGFEEVVIVLPKASEPWLRRIKLPPIGRVEFCRDYRDDYLGQQATKLYADSFTGADFICHIDADCIFVRPTCPEEFILGGKPVILIRASELLGRESPWHGPTEKFLGWPVGFDYMRHPPFTYPRWLYTEVREYCSAKHCVDLDTYIATQPPRSFSEFNVLGAFAQARYRERFVWAEDRGDMPSNPPCRWYWSWGGLDENTKLEIEVSLGISQSNS